VNLGEVMNLLVVDIGNSRIKWGFTPHGKLVAQRPYTHAEGGDFAKALNKFAPPDRIVVSNVSGERGKTVLIEAVGPWGIEPEWVKASRHACGVTNCYDTPDQLGPDRWAALISAHAMQVGECLIISLGTAMTVDWLTASGDYRGGMIVPGKRLMHAALALGTSKIGHQMGNIAGFSCNTADAVESGSAYALAGAVRQAREAVTAARGTPPVCLITGGDTKWIKPMLGFQVTFAPNLVLDGLALMASEDT
jgi:type III pantothenate kinase